MSDRRKAAASAFVNWFVWPLSAILVALKLVGLIDWSWWWVTAPLWAPFAVGFAVVAICGIVWLFADIMERVTKR